MTTCKKITLTAAAMVLSAGLAVGGTLAYLNAVTELRPIHLLQAVILQQHLQKQNGPVIQERIIFQEM